MHFNTNIFQYSTYVDSSLRTRGRLIVHPSAVYNVNCTPNTILRENGKKLHGATHPDLVDPTTNLPYTYLVGVYDVVSGINGFINPSAPYFAILSTDKSYQDDLARYQIDASQNTSNSKYYSLYPYNNTSNQILGPPVNTAGDVISGGYLEGYQVHAVDLIHTLGFIVAGPDSLSEDINGNPINIGSGTILANSNITSLANINASNGTITGSNLVALSNVTVNTGKLILNNACSGLVTQMNVGSTNSGGNFYKTVTTSQCTTSSLIFATPRNLTTVSIEGQSNGGFQIVTPNTYTNSVAWFLIN
jgi:hypothetical protein